MTLLWFVYSVALFYVDNSWNYSVYEFASRIAYEWVEYEPTFDHRFFRTAAK